MFKSAKERLRRELILKIEAVKNCERLNVRQENSGPEKFQAMFAYAFLGGILNKLKQDDDNIPIDEISN